MKIFLIIGGVLLTLVIIASAIKVPPRSGEEIMADIRKNCEREFGSADKAKVDGCVIAVAVEKIRKSEDDKLRRAYEASR